MAGLNDLFSFENYLGDDYNGNGDLWFSRCVINKDIDNDIKKEMYFKKIVVSLTKGKIMFVTRHNNTLERNLNLIIS